MSNQKSGQIAPNPPVYRPLRGQHGLQVVFAASLPLIEQIIKETKLFLKPTTLTKSIWQDIELGIREALSNAICHGAKNHSQATIYYRISRAGPRFIIIKVTDPGVGFDWSTALQIPVPDLAESGRGLPILKKCFDSIEFNKRGNEVKLTKMIRMEDK